MAPYPDWARQFAAALDAVPDTIIVVDGRGRIVIANKRAERMFGFTREELVGESIEALVPEAQRHKHADHRGVYSHRPRARPMGMTDMELSARRKDGSIFPVEISLSPLETESGPWVIAMVRDLTTRGALHERFRTLLEAAPDAMLISNWEGKILMANAWALQLFGYQRDELVGRPLELLVPEENRPLASAEGLLPAHPMGKTGEEVELRKKEGATFPAEVSLRPLRTEEGLLTIAAIRDVTDRRHAEEERARHLEAREAVRLRDEFLSIASHELRTPLTPLLIESESMARLAASSSCPEAIALKAERINRMVLRLHELVEELLDVSRVAAGQLRLELGEVDLKAVAQEVAHRYEEEARRAGCALTLEGPPLVGLWDASRLDQVVSNLVMNALKYGAGRPVEIALSAEGDWATLRVRDHGIGISPEHQARIFERFERAVSRRNYGGFGLGLWIVRQIVEEHGGRVTVSSKPGQGSEFTVVLPLRRAAREVRASPPPP